MRGRRGAALSEFFQALAAGDGVVWGVVIGLLVLAALFGLAALVVGRKLRQLDEAVARKYRPQKQKWTAPPEV